MHLAGLWSMVLGVSHGHKARPLFPPGGCHLLYQPLWQVLADGEKGSCALPSIGSTAHVTIGRTHSADSLVCSWISTVASFVSFLIVIVECMG